MKLIPFILSIILTVNSFGSGLVLLHEQEKLSQENLISNECKMSVDVPNKSVKGTKSCCKGKEAPKESSKESKKDCCNDDCDCNCCHSILVVNIQLPEKVDLDVSKETTKSKFSKSVFGYEFLKGMKFKETLIHPPAIV